MLSPGRVVAFELPLPAGMYSQLAYCFRMPSVDAIHRYR